MSKDQKKSADANTRVDDESTAPDAAGPDEGPSMSGAGAMPSGSEFSNWQTSMPNPDATRPGSMPGTVSNPMPGETGHEDRAKV